MKILNLILVTVLLTSCLGDGTDTGNPGFENADPLIGTANLIDDIIFTTCSLLNDCHAVSTGDCTTALLLQSNIDTELGLDDNDFPTLNAIRLAVSNSTLTADFESVTLCEDNIEALACSAPLVINAYDSMASNPYEGTAAALPTSCSGIF